MSRIPCLVAACLALASALSMATAASTCTIGTASNPTNCQVTAGGGMFTWTLSDLHMTVANANVDPSVLTLNVAASGVPGADQLRLSQQVVPPSGNVLPNGMPLILDLSFNLSVTSTLAATGPTPPENSQSQTYLNGLLLATIASQGFIPGVSQVDGSFLNQETTVAVDGVFIVNQYSGTNIFSESFDIADPGTGGGATGPPPSSPEPATFALLGSAALVTWLSKLMAKKLGSTSLPIDSHSEPRSL